MHGLFFFVFLKLSFPALFDSSRRLNLLAVHDYKCQPWQIIMVSQCRLSMPTAIHKLGERLTEISGNGCHVSVVTIICVYGRKIVSLHHIAETEVGMHIM